MLSSCDIADAMQRCEPAVACFMGMSRPRHVKWTPVRLPGSKNPTRFYSENGIIEWLSQSYAFFDAKLESRLRQRAADNREVYGDTA